MHSSDPIEETTLAPQALDPAALAQALADSVALHQAGYLEKAAQGYCRILKEDPNHADALHLLGLITNQLGDSDTAISLIGKAIERQPSVVPYRHSLGDIYLTKKDFERAYFCYQEVLKLQPDSSPCHHQLGRIAVLQNRMQTAVGHYRAAIALDPQNAEAYSDLGKIMIALDDIAAADQFFRLALSLQPDLVEAQCNLGNTLRKQNRIAEAIGFYRRVLSRYQENSAKDSIYWQVQNNLALSLLQSGENDAAIDCYRQALAMDPQNALLHTNFAYLLLSLGHFQEGWLEHEWRWSMADFSTKIRDFGCPQWKGEPLHGGTVLLHCEQGLGDTIQFVRYAPLLAGRDGKVILEVQPRLQRLLSDMPGVTQVISRGEPLPEISWHCPLMSLPLAFGTTLETVPAPSSYISVIKEPRQFSTNTELRVGLSWAGSPNNPHNSYRSIPLRQFIPLSSLPDITFYSLQFGEGVQQIAEVSSELPLIDACSQHKDFAESAAFLAGLDLVITIDTAIAHLAGALGIPVWILLAHSRADWRWMLHRKDSPWYPSARLFRQRNPDDWESVILQVREALQRLLRI